MLIPYGSKKTGVPFTKHSSHMIKLNDSPSILLLSEAEKQVHLLPLLKLVV